MYFNFARKCQWVRRKPSLDCCTPCTSHTTPNYPTCTCVVVMPMARATLQYDSKQSSSFRFPVHEIDRELVTYKANNSREILVTWNQVEIPILRVNNSIIIQI